MKNKNYKSFIFFTIFLTVGASAFAHPHLYMENTIEFVWEKDQLKGAYLEWTFDRYFSADIINWLDVDKNGRFNATESVEVYNNAFINLENYYYYTFIREGTKRTNPSGVSEFKAIAKNGIMTYQFFIDLSEHTGNELYFAVYDYTFFCNISFSESAPVQLTYNFIFVQPAFSITKNQTYPIYYDPLSPITDTTIYNKWEPGLQTYYPSEIKLTW